jgi:uncharacterized protein (TIGR02466 family)
MNKIDIFNFFILEEKNLNLANLLKIPCEELLKKCDLSNFYKNGITTYFQKDKNLSDFNLWKDNNFVLFRNYVLSLSYEYILQLNLNKKYQPIITSMWISKMNKNGLHEFHNHGKNSHLCGNFFINCDEKSSFLIFQKPDLNNDIFIDLNYNTFDSSNSLEWKIKPEIGKIILWKSNLIHGVRLNESNNRISISFNVSLV